MWKNLKTYFIVEEDESKKSPTRPSLPDHRGAKGKPGPPTAKPSGAAPASAPAPPADGAPPEGKVSDKFVAVLLQAMEKANLDGFDYLEYKKSLQNLEKMNFDDALRFQTAFAAAQSMGVTPAQLVESAEHYLRTLKGEEDKFQAALGNQRNDQIARREEQLARLDQRIKEQEAKIRELEAQIAKTRGEKEKLSKGIAASAGKIAATQADFERTYRTITDSIHGDIAKMREYLK